MSDERSHMTSGSAIERALQCTASMALPHADHESIYTERGSVIHAFLEDVSAIGRDEALTMVPDDYRDVCEALDISGLDLQLSLAAEVAIAYDVETDTARELGRGEGRKYDDVKQNEIPCTLDVVGVRDVPRGRRALVVDWKSGYTTRRNIDGVLQLDFGALAVSRCFDAGIAEVQLIHVREESRPWIQRRTLTGFELDAFALEVRTAYTAALELRDKLRAGEPIKTWKTGPWCERCPSWNWCPAQMNLVKSLLSGDEFSDVLRTTPIPESTLVWVWDRLEEAQRTISRLKGICLGAAATRPIRLGTTPDGQERWLGSLLREGNDKLDGQAAYDVLFEMFDPDLAAKATKRTATKKDVIAAIKLAVPKGQGAKKMRAFLETMEARGGIDRDWKDSPIEFTRPPPGSPPPATPALPEIVPMSTLRAADAHALEQKALPAAPESPFDAAPASE